MLGVRIRIMAHFHTEDTEEFAAAPDIFLCDPLRKPLRPLRLRVSSPHAHLLDLDSQTESLCHLTSRHSPGSISSQDSRFHSAAAQLRQSFDDVAVVN